MKQQPPSALDPGERPPSALQHVAPSPPKDLHPARRRRSRWVWLLLLAAAGIASYYLWPKLTVKKSAPPRSAAAKGGRGPVATPVDAAKPRKGDQGVNFNLLAPATP